MSEMAVSGQLLRRGAFAAQPFSQGYSASHGENIDMCAKVNIFLTAMLRNLHAKRSTAAASSIDADAAY
jgi:hypothetical protein